MAAYLANQIKLSRLDYLQAVTKCPQFKADIDLILISDGYAELVITED